MNWCYRSLIPRHRSIGLNWIDFFASAPLIHPPSAHLVIIDLHISSAPLIHPPSTHLVVRKQRILHQRQCGLQRPQTHALVTHSLNLVFGGGGGCKQ